MSDYALFVGTTYLGTFSYGSAQVATNGAFAIARRRNLTGAISVLPVLKITDLAA